MNQNKMIIYRGLALFVAGILSNILVNLIFSSPRPNIVLLVVIIIILLGLYGLGITTIIEHYINMKKRNFDRRIGILNDLPDRDADNISPKDWKTEIDKSMNMQGIRIRVDLINVKMNFDPYIAILNPYGCIYPENDLEDFETLDKIFKYVIEGGLFINVSDIPGYRAKKPNLSGRIDTIDPIYGINLEGNEMTIIKIKPLELTPFIKNLRLQVVPIIEYEWNIEIEKNLSNIPDDTKISVERVIIIEKDREDDVKSIIKTKKLEDITKTKSVNLQNEIVTPFFFVKHGEGRFLISLNFLAKNKIMKETIIETMINLLINKAM